MTLPPGVRTFKPRRSRITPRASAALAARPAALLPMTDIPLHLDEEFGSPVILEIGFGSAEATALLAAEDPRTGILAVDVHTPGVGDLLDVIAREELANVRVIEGDAVVVLERMISPGSLAGVRSFFPDPWPKARHHKRRLVQPAVIDLVATRLQPGGWWHVATDWAEYVTAIEAAFDDRPGWSGGVVDRPSWRPVTRYEQRALREGRDVVDLLYVRD